MKEISECLSLSVEDVEAYAKAGFSCESSADHS